MQVKRARPQARIAVLDVSRQAAPHTWCLFESDLPRGWPSLPLALDNVWDGYTVEFPKLTRRLRTGYGRLSSTTLRQALAEALGDDLIVGEAREVFGDRVVCADGRELSARIVIDGRGDRASPHLDLAFQKFVGLELKLDRSHGLERPILMDATVPQLDGYRFLYVLPLSPDRLLVEDTRYSDTPDLDVAAFEGEILRYAQKRGWAVDRIVGRETGALPILLDGDIDRFWSEPGRSEPSVGMRGAFFHPTTGYSFPDAVAVAGAVIDRLDDGPAALAAALQTTSKKLWRERAFYRLLNRMLYRAAEPDQRYLVLQRFYGLDAPLIERFYAGKTRFADKARILCGRPPVPLARALRVVTQPRTDHASA